MSKTHPIRGRTLLMYVKFCSGPTPIYAPPGCAICFSLSTMCRYGVSFELKLPEWKYPPGSEISSLIFEKSAAHNDSGDPFGEGSGGIGFCATGGVAGGAAGGVC